MASFTRIGLEEFGRSREETIGASVMRAEEKKKISRLPGPWSYVLVGWRESEIGRTLNRRGPAARKSWPGQEFIGPGLAGRIIQAFRRGRPGWVVWSDMVLTLGERDGVTAPMVGRKMSSGRSVDYMVRAELPVRGVFQYIDRASSPLSVSPEDILAEYESQVKSPTCERDEAGLLAVEDLAVAELSLYWAMDRSTPDRRKLVVHRLVIRQSTDDYFLVGVEKKSSDLGFVRFARMQDDRHFKCDGTSGLFDLFASRAWD